MKDVLFSKTTLQKIQKARKILLKLAVWLLIAGLVLGAILILIGSWDMIIGRIQGTLLILAPILFASVNNFICMEKGKKSIQIFALLGFVSNLLWGIFAVLLVWKVLPFYWTEEIIATEVDPYGGQLYPSSSELHITPYVRIMLILAYTAVTSFCVSNILAIKETIKSVKPLKITAIVCAAYLWFFGTIVTLLGLDFEFAEKVGQLAGLAGLAFCIATLAAVIISRTYKKNE